MEITKKQIFSYIFLFFSFFSFFGITPTKADETLLEGQEGLTEIKTVFGGERAERDIRDIITDFILIALTFLGVIFLVLTIWAGFKYMTSAGNSEQTSGAIKLLRNAVIGLLIIMTSWMITRYIIVMGNRAVSNSADPTYYPRTGM